MKKKIITLTLCLLIILSICFVPDVDAGTPTLNLTNSTYYIEVGKSFAIKLNGLKASKVKWSSSNKSVATVSKKGVVKSLKKGKTTITGKYKKLKFKIKINVVAKDNGEYSVKDTDLKFNQTRVYEEDRDLYWEISFTFTNNAPYETSFQDVYNVEAYINNVQDDAWDEIKANTKVKNGASVNVKYGYEVKSGDKIEFKIYTYNDDYDKIIVYTTSEVIK